MNLLRCHLAFCLIAFIASAALAVPAAAMTIAEARALGTGQNVTISQAVIANTTDTIAASTSSSFQVQDETGGITVFGTAAQIAALLQGLEAGDSMIGLSGTTGQFNGLFQLQAPFNLAGSVAGSGPPEPLPVTPHDFQNQSPTAEALESRLLSLRDVTFSQSGSFSGPQNYIVSSGDLQVTVRVTHNSLPIAGESIPNGRVNITGIFSRFNNDYQLLLIAPEDLTASSSFDRWMTQYFIGAELRDPEIGGSGGDVDGDGAGNLIEFALGGHPRIAGTASLPTVSIGQNGDAKYLQLRFRRMAAAADAVYRVEVSSDATEWQTIWNSVDYPFPSWAGDWELRIVPDPLPVHHADRRFIRLTVDAPDGQLPPPVELEPLRIVTWNIEWFPGRKSNATPAEEEAHIAGVRDYLSTVNPDVLLLQEVRDPESVAAAVSLLDGFQVHIVSAFSLAGGVIGRQQLAIASRLPAHTAFAERFVSPGGGDPTPPRGFAFAALELPGNRVLLNYSLHLKSNGSGTDEQNIAIREESARQVLAHVADMRAFYANRQAVYLAVGGDFNVRLESGSGMEHEQTIELFKDDGFHSTWDGVPPNQRVTWPGRGGFPDATFDYILLDNLGTSTATVLQQPNPDLSDHNPVQVTVQP